MSPCHLVILSSLPALIRWESPRLLPVVIACGAMLAAAVVWLYPAQVRLVRRPWRWVMPGLRAVALLTLVLALARPVAVRREPAGERGTVVVLVDRSGSMNVTDGGRSHAELVALADALGMLPPGVREGARGDAQPSQDGATTRPAAPGPSTSPASQASQAPARITTVSQLASTFAAVRSAAQEAFRAQGDLDYARISGQGIEAALARRDESANRLSDLARPLAQADHKLLPGQANVGLRQRLQALAQLPGPGTRGWVAVVRQRIDRAGAALEEYRLNADSRLYDSNPEVRAACSAVAQLTRFDLACVALLRPKTGLVARLGGETRCAGFAFADDVQPLGTLRPSTSAALEAPAPPADGGDDVDDEGADRALAGMNPTAGPAPPGPPMLPVKPDGAGTDLGNAVTSALTLINPRTVRAVVVVSDGKEVGISNASPPPAAAGIPVFAVSSAPAATRDLALERVQVPASVFVGERIYVRASVRTTGPGPAADGGDIRLILGDGGAAAGGVAGGAGPAREPDRKGRDHDGTPNAEFFVKLDQPGTQLVTLTVPPVPGEATTANNTIRRWVKVLPTRIHVAAYAGTAEWDFQYLRGALSRERYIQLEAGVLDPAHPDLPLTPEQILQQDVLILYDVPVGALNTNQWDAVYAKLVKERGGSVILVAGSGGAVLDYGSQVAASALLPFNPMRVKPAWKVWPGERPNFRLAPAQGWENSDFAEALRLDAQEAPGRRWQDLPPLFRVMPVPDGQLRANAQPMLVEPESKGAVLSQVRPGLGRSLLLGMDETWRWRLGVGEKFQDRFWLQLVRFAAGAPYAVREGPVALDVDDVSVRPGKPVHVRVRLYEQAVESAATANPAAMRVELLSGGQARDSAPLTEVGAGSGRWQATLNSPDEGDYEIRFRPPAAGATGPGTAVPGTADPAAPAPTTTPADAAPVELRVPLHVTGRMEAEMRDVSGDADRLRRLAESTGGELIRLDEIATLPERLANLGQAHPRVTELRLWDSPYLFAFVVACFAAEWALRKRFGLA